MGAGKNRYVGVFDLIPDKEREAVQNGTANVAIKSGIDEWRLFQSCQYVIELVEKLRAQSRTLALVPVLSICHIPFRGAADVNAEAQLSAAVV